MDRQQQVCLTFTGDILCSEMQNKVSRIGEDCYVYDSIFAGIRDLFIQADYVCGSLETPLAGKELGYSESAINFNTPDSFAEALKKVGIDMVTTSNNHCLDRGIIGLKRTINVLDEFGLEHIGTYLTREDSEHILIKDFDGLKVSFLSYTYGTNSRSNKHFLEGEDIYLVDLFRRQDRLVVQKISFIKKCIRKIKRKLFSSKDVKRSKIVLDNVPSTEITNSDNQFYVERLRSKISKAKELSDIVVLCMHGGGQFNFREGPGEYTKYLMQTALDAGVNIVVGNHTHCVLPAEWYDNQALGVYSLGNFCFTPRDGYYVDGVYADYSVVLNIYLDKINKCLGKVTFFVTKSVRAEDNGCVVKLVYDLFQSETDEEQKRILQQDNLAVISRFINKELQELPVEKEYDFCLLTNKEEKLCL